MRSSLPNQAALFLLVTAFVSGVSRADFIPIVLTSDSLNQDVVVEKTAPSPIVPVTTASMDSGITNTGFSWYEKGYHLDWPATGLPAPGSSITSANLADHNYQFATSYKSNNAILVDAMLSNSTLTLATPTPCSRLSFLLSSGNGPGNFQVIIRHQDATSETKTNSCTDWMAASSEAYLASGRVDVGAFTFDSINAQHPMLFSRDVTLFNTNSAVTSIEFGYVGGAAHNAIFAVSASTNMVDPFTPLVVTGYNTDLVVEASATRRLSLGSATSASMESGTVNAGRTWYERGYYPPAAGTGLPAAGSFVTNNFASDHVFVMPPSYTTNNVLMIDSLLDNGTLTPATPAPYAALSFLCASGHGPVTNQCVIAHANGLLETNNLIVPNWFDNSPAAFIANGDLNLNTRMTDSVGANNPKLFALDVALANTASPVTNVLLTFKGGAADSHSVFFAVSGLPAQGSGNRPALTISHLSSGNLRISTSQPGQLQSTTALNGTNTVWQNEGLILNAIDVSPVSGTSGKFYRVIGQ
jgi:hypothetical protein